MKITRKLEFDAGHRVLGHEGKCATPHGHRYVAELTVSADALDSLGRVIDFSVIKTLVGGWIDANWDHTMILHPDDPLLQYCGLIGPRPPYVIPRRDDGPFQSDGNPTAENMSKYLFGVAGELLRPHGIRVEAVRLYETPNCWADYAGESA